MVMQIERKSSFTADKTREEMVDRVFPDSGRVAVAEFMNPWVPLPRTELEKKLGERVAELAHNTGSEVVTVIQREGWDLSAPAFTVEKDGVQDYVGTVENVLRHIEEDLKYPV